MASTNFDRIWEGLLARIINELDNGHDFRIVHGQYGVSVCNVPPHLGIYRYAVILAKSDRVKVTFFPDIYDMIRECKKSFYALYVMAPLCPAFSVDTTYFDDHIPIIGRLTQ